MRIIDPLINSIGLGYSASRDTIGIVIKPQSELDDRPMLGLVIPKFMLGYEFKDGVTAQDIDFAINNSKCVNEDSDSYWDSSIVIKNYIIVRPYLNQNQHLPTFTVGDKVIVTMIDDDIKTLAFLPYTINRLGQRKTDKYIVNVPGNPNENTEVGEVNSYFFKMDSNEDIQKIVIQTSKENGEVCSHTIELNSKDGLLTITDNEDRKIEIDTQNDSIITTTSGTKIEQIGDTINMQGDTLNIKMDSKISMETDTIEVKSNSIKSQASDVKYEYDNFKQTTTTGKYEIDSEQHSGMSMKFQESTFDDDTPINAIKGKLAVG